MWGRRSQLIKGQSPSCFFYYYWPHFSLCRIGRRTIAPSAAGIPAEVIRTQRSAARAGKLRRASVEPRDSGLKVMVLTPAVTQSRAMLRRAGAIYVCGKWSRPARTFSLWWGDVFSLSNRSGKNTFALFTAVQSDNWWLLPGLISCTVTVFFFFFFNSSWKCTGWCVTHSMVSPRRNIGVFVFCKVLRVQTTGINWNIGVPAAP